MKTCKKSADYAYRLNIGFFSDLDNGDVSWCQ